MWTAAEGVNRPAAPSVLHFGDGTRQLAWSFPFFGRKILALKNRRLSFLPSGYSIRVHDKSSIHEEFAQKNSLCVRGLKPEAACPQA
jgi:hypothetical protein